LFAAVQVCGPSQSKAVSRTQGPQATRENSASIEDIVEKVEDITASMAQLAVEPPAGGSPASTSSDLASRIERFNRFSHLCIGMNVPAHYMDRELVEIKDSVTRY
jgi:methyl-accepting chemotaxis protein